MAKAGGMKTIGLLGGMSWESTATYYRLINEGIKARLGGLHSARLCLYSVDFEEIEKFQAAGDWDRAGMLLADAGRRVEASGADFLVLCTNTMHKVAPRIEAEIGIPMLHIADATGAQIRARGFSKVGLLGTRFTMEDDFYRGRLAERYGLEVLAPDAEERSIVHDVIYRELCLGEIREASREAFLEIIGRLRDRGAEGVILGCTEIALLVQQAHTHVPIFDTTEIHAQAAVEKALSD